MKATIGDLEILSRLKTEPQDPAASSVVFERYYDLLVLFLRKRFPKVDADEIYEMAFATLDRLIKMPHRFNPERSTLEQFLRTCWGFSAGGKNEGFFRPFSRF